MGRTLFWLVVSLGITVGLTFLLWVVFDWPVLFGFLFLPFLFGFGNLFGRRREEAERAEAQVRTCPRCGFQSLDPEVRYCPRDGSPLV